MSRVPKAGEVWTRGRQQWRCAVDVPDQEGCYVWEIIGEGYAISKCAHLTPPARPSPAFERWLNCYAEKTGLVIGARFLSRDDADLHATEGRTHVLHLWTEDGELRSEVEEVES